MSEASRMVAAFHYATGSPVFDTPAMISDDRLILRQRLLSEESDEACAEFEYALEDDGDLARIAKELADVLYVTYGAALEFGIDLDAVLAEVHRSNMAKVGGARREDGKQLKPEGWQPPDIRKVLGI